MKLAQIVAINQTNPEASTLKQMDQSYKAGAISILSNVAKLKVNEIEEANTVSLSEDTKARSKETSRLYNKLMMAIKHDPELVNLVFKFDTVACDWASSQSDDYFVQGFLEGYRFLSAVKCEDEI
ncbi:MULTISPECIES: hypothetical protein [Bacteria]|uniref:hypothetical protein n=1 Tax=Bacteria TaxID=2 RepID=UPI0007D7A4BC